MKYVTKEKRCPVVTQSSLIIWKFHYAKQDFSSLGHSSSGLVCQTILFIRLKSEKKTTVETIEQTSSFTNCLKYLFKSAQFNTVE